MTPARKKVIELLLNGHNIAAAGSRFRLLDGKGNPVQNVAPRTLAWLKAFDLLRADRRGVLVINKNKVRQWHGNSFIKRAYKGKTRGPDALKSPPLKKVPESPFLSQPTLF